MNFLFLSTSLFWTNWKINKDFIFALFVTKFFTFFFPLVKIILLNSYNLTLNAGFGGKVLLLPLFFLRKNTFSPPSTIVAFLCKEFSSSLLTYWDHFSFNLFLLTFIPSAVSESSYFRLISHLIK